MWFVCFDGRFKFEHHDAALTNFQVNVDGVVYSGVCKDTDEAKDDYDDAIAAGHGAYMVEKKENIFNVSIGSIPAGKECLLTFRYVTELLLEDGNLQLVLPITKVPLSAEHVWFLVVLIVG